MDFFFEAFDAIQKFLETGGAVLWGILFVSLLLWALIIDRYWYIYRTHRQHFKARIIEWKLRANHRSWTARQIRKALLSEGESDLQQSLLLITALTKVLPLMGLLGTVTGMIGTFDVMTRFGTGNARGMATGISEALVTTMAGLVTALSGLYFSIDLRRRVLAEKQLMAERLSES